MPTQQCLTCRKASIRTCDGCKNVRYCSSTCQKSDWYVHKQLCSTYTNFADSTRPTPGHHRAIFFPENLAKPEFLWLERNWNRDKELEYEILDPYLLDPRSVALKVLDLRHIPLRSFEERIVLAYRDDYLSDISDSEDNESTDWITVNKHTELFPRKGPIVVFGGLELDHKDGPCRDVDLNDFRRVVDYLTAQKVLT